MKTGQGQFEATFSWKEGREPTIVDTKGNLLKNAEMPLYSGSKVKLSFYQSGYNLPDGQTIGTKLHPEAIQVHELFGGEEIENYITPMSKKDNHILETGLMLLKDYPDVFAAIKAEISKG